MNRPWAQRLAEVLTRDRHLPWAGVRADWTLLPLNGEALVVRGRVRHRVPPTLFATSYWGELEPTLLQTLGYLVAPSGRLVRRERILNGLSVSEAETKGVEDQHLAIQAAALAAGRHLGYGGTVQGEGILVVDVNPEGPNRETVRRGDVITHLDGIEVRTLPDLLAGIGSRRQIRARIIKAQTGTPREPEEEVTLQRDEELLFGMEVRTHRQVVHPGVDIEVHLPAEMAGPSIGLILALSIVDVLTPGSLTGGRKVAGTGSIGPQGEVLAVGGITQKLRSVKDAHIPEFLCPKENAPEALEAARGRVHVHPVESLEEAVATLERHRV